MSKIIVKIDKEEPIEFGFKSDVSEYLENIRKSGRYYFKISVKEGWRETIFVHHLSNVCEEIMKHAATRDGVIVDIKLGKDGEMTLVQKICAKLEMEGLIEENEFRDKDLVHRLTKKGLAFYNDYKSIILLRSRKKLKVIHTGVREKVGIYNIR